MMTSRAGKLAKLALQVMGGVATPPFPNPTKNTCTEGFMDTSNASMKPFHLFALTLFALSTTASDKPNFVVIMADDIGYGDLSCYGATRVQTPHLDKLAADGIKFTSGYCSASTCTPTRYSFLTGDYAFRRPRTGIAPPDAPACLIQPDRHTIAKQLKKAGYKTAVVGKWHLGLGEEGVWPLWNEELRPTGGDRI